MSQIIEIFSNPSLDLSEKIQSLLILLAISEKNIVYDCLIDSTLWSSILLSLLPGLSHTEIGLMNDTDYTLLSEAYHVTVKNTSPKIQVDERLRLVYNTYKCSPATEKEAYCDEFSIVLSLDPKSSFGEMIRLLDHHYYREKCEGLCHNRALFKDNDNHLFCGEACYRLFRKCHSVL
jgi:hypothetical protein